MVGAETDDSLLELAIWLSRRVSIGCIRCLGWNVLENYKPPPVGSKFVAGKLLDLEM